MESVASKFPHLIEEWHPDNPHPPEHYYPHSQYRVKWLCTKCPVDPGCHVWETAISDRTCTKKGCPFCGGKYVCEHMSLAARFPKLVEEEWDYEKNEVDPSTVSYGSSINYFWICSNERCGESFLQSPGSRTHSMQGCPRCASSKGEKITTRVLTELEISFKTEFKLPSLIGKSFDFEFEWEGQKFIIEFDGKQHFKRIKYFYKTQAQFAEARYRDILKHLTAVSSRYDYKVIRIDYRIPKSEEEFKKHILEGLETPFVSYFSTPSLYNWLNDAENDFHNQREGLSEKEELKLCETLAQKYAQLVTEEET